ncbi:FO synthase subunit 2 [Porphyridium purpureum]|uniref:FO synthase subunit 2 n=1 Tax=Porphyridium purpureum TaxID=35688 RepID=A0A5J4YVD3_PORPP|nr:FO synthase subunit 2 [Porphyridium purpureum]|eukprot:POR9207..scf227_4
MRMAWAFQRRQRCCKDMLKKMSHVARHLPLLKQTRRETQGSTEFVPLGFVSDNASTAQLGYRGRHAKPVPVCKGPIRLERILVHAVSRLVLGRFIPNLQVSFVKEGSKDAEVILECGANVLGGTLMNESISTAAGSRCGQLQSPTELKTAIRELRRVPVERSTAYYVLKWFDVDSIAHERKRRVKRRDRLALWQFRVVDFERRRGLQG